MTAELQHLFFSILPAELHNQYGPTETTVDVLFWNCQRDCQRQVVPLGYPIDNTSVYVLDAYQQAVLPGVAGELHIGGMPLARGYLKRAELTAERFVPNPFSASEGERLYRTGDRVRWQSDGSLEFLGRFDHQVKVRGYRIELGEIEAAVEKHEAVEQAVVLAREDQPGEKRLVGYLVMKEAGREDFDVTGLRAYLKESLPDYMVPGFLVKLEALPLTPNGKVDRKALPEPEYTVNEEQSRPRNAEEEILCGIFAEVLKLDRVGVEQNFFEAGGHSLLATQVMARVRSVFAVELPLRAMFELPTVAGLAERVVRERGAEQIQAPALVRVGRAGDLPLSYAQQRLWFLDQLEPGGVAYNMPFGLRLEGELDREALAKSFDELVKRHESLRTRFAVKDGSPVQVIAEEREVKIEEVDLCGLGLAEREAEARRVAQKEAATPFDLSQGPLLRVKLLQMDEQEHVLLVTMHHIVSDGWSSGIIVREYARLYEAGLKKEEAGLAELKIQYADYAVWQREWLQGEVLEEQIGYWRKQLAELQPLELPVDYARPAVMSQRGASVPFAISSELSGKLKELSGREGVTLFMSLLAAFQVVLSKYAGQEDIAVGTTVANRPRVEVEDLIGFFVNTLVMRTDLGGNPSFVELLKRVRQHTLDAYQHQDVPFERLVEELQPERDLSRSPLFQVMLVLQNTEQEELRMPGLRLSEFGIESGVAKVELVLTVCEGADGIHGEISYARDLYEAGTVERLVGHLYLALTAMVEEPGQRIGELSLLTGAEREQVLVEWNRTKTEYPKEKCLAAWFEEQVERTPRATAVVYEDQQMTYDELNRKANQLGHYLRKQGGGPEVRVGICMERSLEMVVGLLGILKAGGAYVPLDPSYPPERIGYILEDTRAKVLLTQAEIEPRFPLHEAKVLDLEKRWKSIAQESTDNPRTETTWQNAAYVIYTSGSTGKPKGVVVNHGNVVRLFNATQHWFEF